MGLNRLLKESVAGEEEKILKESKPKEIKNKEDREDKVDIVEEKEDNTVINEAINKRTGEEKRKQYTYTLFPSFYKVINDYLESHRSISGRRMSFSELIETALIEYMENHR